MKRALVVGISAAVLAGSTGCASTGTIGSPPLHIAIPADKPPPPTTWPKYPQFSGRSCWARPFIGGTVSKIQRVAPSYALHAPSHPIAPAVVARRLLARLGDRRYVRSIRFTPAPPAVGGRVRALYAGGHPPAGALQARILVRGANYVRHPSPEQSLATGIATYEGEIVGDALRDDLCDAGGAPLVMWGTNGGSGFADRGLALDQRFPNPSAAAFRKRVALVGRRFGFTVVSLRLLRPRQIAPLLIVKTHRPRKAFTADIPKIMELLNPHTYLRSRGQTAWTFEAFFFAAEDAKGPFVFSQGASRSETEGGEWAANRCLYPYPVLGPVGPGGQKCS